MAQSNHVRARHVIALLPSMAAFCLVGCVHYERSALVPRAELDALDARALPTGGFLQLVPADAEPPQVATFDLSNGLDDRELMAVAVSLNPDLQIARAAIGESEALLVTAKTLPNPEFGLGFGLGLPGTDGFKLDADLLLQLINSGERNARQAVATAKISASRAEVLAKEYDVAAEARLRAFDVLVSEQAIAMLDAESMLRQQASDLIRRRRDAGEANELDVSAVDLELVEVHRDRRLAVIERDLARLALNQSLGLPPGVEVPLEQTGRTLDVPLIDVPSEAQIEERLLSNRLDLKAQEARYEVAEQELRLAVARQYLKLRAGPMFSHEGSDADYAGVAASVEIPIFDRNQGEIAETTAARDRMRAEYAADLHRLRAESASALARVRGAREEIDIQNREVVPLLDRSQALYRSAFEARELSVLDWITAQQRSLRARRAYLDTVISYRRALLDLETLSGLPTWRIAPASDSSTQTSTDRSDSR